MPVGSRQTVSDASMDPISRHLVLVGGMGTGKTSVGRALAEQMDRPLLDSDDQLLAYRGQTGRQYADRHGVSALHRDEARHLLGTLASDEPAVVAAAASVVEGGRCLEALRDAEVVWLRASPETASRRIQHSTDRRPLGPDFTEAMAALADRRAPRYQQVADLVIDTDDLQIEDVVSEVLAWLTLRYG